MQHSENQIIHANGPAPIPSANRSVLTLTPMHLLFSKEKQEAEISRQAMEACEQIISEMGAELHDDLIQRLSVFRLTRTGSGRSPFARYEGRLSRSNPISENDLPTTHARSN